MDFKSICFLGGGGSVRWPGGAAAARDERGAAGHREVLRAPHGAEARARGARAQRGARVQQRAVRGLGAGHRAQEHSQDTPAGENNAGADKSQNILRLKLKYAALLSENSPMISIWRIFLYYQTV